MNRLQRLCRHLLLWAFILAAGFILSRLESGWAPGPTAGPAHVWQADALLKWREAGQTPLSEPVVRALPPHAGPADRAEPLRAQPSVEDLPSSAILDEAVIRVQDGVPIETVASRYAARVLGRLDGLNAARLQFGDAQEATAARTELAADPEVASVELNYSVTRPPVAEAVVSGAAASTGLKITPGDSGGRTVVALIDTAVQAEASGIGDFLLPSLSLSGQTDPGSDTLTHGTSMAEAILQGLGALPGQASSSVRILPVDIYGESTGTTTYQVAQGVAKATEAGASVINLSLGSDGDSSLLQQVIQQAHEQGIVILGAAGNEPVTSAVYPAAYPEVIAVTAIDESGSIASYANRGSFIDVGVPGSVTVNFFGQSYVVNGTSASTALASGVLAGLMEKQKLTAAQAEQVLRSGLAVSK